MYYTIYNTSSFCKTSTSEHAKPFYDVIFVVVVVAVVVVVCHNMATVIKL